MREGSRISASLPWRVLRRLLPAAWRERHGAEMLRVHVELAGGGARARGLRFWAVVARDVMLTAIQVRLDSVRGGGGRPVDRSRVSIVEAPADCVRHALRSLRRSPGFAVMVIGIFALGIAANTTMFRVVDRVLLSAPPHIRSPDEVRRVNVLGRNVFTGEVGYSEALAFRDYVQLQALGVTQGVAGHSRRDALTLADEGGAETVRTGMVTASFFDVLGARPALGRFFTPEEDRLGATDRVAVLGNAFWQRRYGGAADVIGREVKVGRGSYVVIGVAPRGFSGVDIEPVDVWLPLVTASEIESGTQWVDALGWYMMSAVVRVDPERIAAVEEAATRAYHAGRAERVGSRGHDPDARVVLTPLIAARGPNASDESRVARLLGVLTALVLLVTCANVVNLFLARVLSRRRELAVQAALGVGRVRLFGQLLAEVTLLAFAAAVFSLWLSDVAGQALFRALLPDALPPAGLDSRVLAATLAITLVTIVLAGVPPALRGVRADVMSALRQQRTTGSARNARRALLVAQAALSVVLLVGAGLFMRSLRTADTLDLGMDRPTLAINVALESGADFGGEVSSAVREGLAAVREHAAVETAAATSILPFSGWWGMPVMIQDGDSLPGDANGPFVYGVTGDYFETLGLEIVRGRALADADDLAGAPRVAVVNEAFARAAWPGRDAIGRCIIPRSGDDPACTTVVGVARNVVQTVRADEAPRIYYLPASHPAFGSPSTNALLVRARAGADPDAIRRAVMDAVPAARFATVRSIEELVAPQLRSWRLGASLLTAFGVLALVIAAAGMYSTLAFDVTQRRRELGVRAALGASTRRLIHNVVGGTLATTVTGIGIGLLLAIAAGRAVEAMLFRVRAADPAVYATVAVTLLTAAILAALIPARAAMRVDPATTLRED